MAITRKPIKHSPVHHKLAQIGAVLVEVYGWALADHFGNVQEEAEAVRSRVGLYDLSSTAKFEVKGTYVSEYLGGVLGGPVPAPGRAALAGSGYGCRISRHHAMFSLIGGNPADAAYATRLRDMSSRFPCVHVTDRSSGLGCFLLCGPQACAVLRKLSALDVRETVFPNLSCACAPMAGVRALLVRKDRGGLPGYEIHFSREYGEYLWDAVREAGEEFRMRPFGLLAARRLEQ